MADHPRRCRKKWPKIVPQRGDEASFQIDIQRAVQKCRASHHQSINLIEACAGDFRSEHRKDVATDIVRIVLKCLSKDRDQRYATAAELLGELQQRRSNAATSVPVPRASTGDDARTVTEHETVVARQIPRAAVSEADVPIVRYAASGDVNIAYQVLGNGPFDLVFVMGWVSHLEWFWQESSFAAFLRRLATFARVILFDKRGTGLSDRVPVDQLPTLELRMDGRCAGVVDRQGPGSRLGITVCRAFDIQRSGPTTQSVSGGAVIFAPERKGQAGPKGRLKRQCATRWRPLSPLGPFRPLAVGSANQDVAQVPVGDFAAEPTSAKL